MKKENPSSFFVNIDQGIHKLNLKVARNEKKTMWDFFFNFGKF